MQTLQRALVALLLLSASHTNGRDLPTIASADGALVVFDETWRIVSHRFSAESPQSVTATLRRSEDGPTVTISMTCLPGIRSIAEDTDQMDSVILRGIDAEVTRLSSNDHRIKMITRDQKSIEFKGVRAGYFMIGPDENQGGFLTVLSKHRKEMVRKHYLALILNTSLILMQSDDTKIDPLECLDSCIIRMS